MIKRYVTVREEKAARLATEAHRGQTYQNDPYIAHPRRVVGLLVNQGVTDEDTLIVAWLHDVVEDCPGYTLEGIREAFGSHVATAVDAITRRVIDDHKESEDAYLRRVLANRIAREVKFCDTADNWLMARSKGCLPHKRDLWPKYANAMQVLMLGEMRHDAE